MIWPIANYSDLNDPRRKLQLSAKHVSTMQMLTHTSAEQVEYQVERY